MKLILYIALGEIHKAIKISQCANSTGQKNKEVNQMPKEEREYKQVKGVLLIQPNGNIFVGKEQMQDGDIIRIPTETLKKIISDVHSGYI